MFEFKNPYAGKPALVLTDSQRAAARAEIKNLYTAASLLFTLLEQDKPIEAETAHVSLSAIESSLVKTANTVGIELHTAEEQEKRNADIRAANLRIRELEKARGDAVTPKDTALSVRALSERMKAWWGSAGLGYVPKVSLTDYGSMEVTLSCRASAMQYYLSDEADDDESSLAKWHDALRAYGFDMEKEPGDEDLALIDSDANRKLVEQLITRAMPSAYIVKTTNHLARNGKYHMRDVEVLIRELDDVASLPVPAKK